MLKRIVILGNKGFIGRHLERHFHKNSPDVEVIGKNLPEVDLTDKDQVLAIAQLFDVDTAVILLAAKKRQFGDTMDAFGQNLRIATNLCSLLEQRPVGRFVFFSSSAVYGEDVHNTNITEETPVCPTSYYGMAKFISERLLWKTLSRQRQSPFLIVRPPTIYGPGDKGETYGPVKFTNAAIKKESITLWGDGSELREFMYIDDIADIIRRLIFSPFNGVVNIASGTSYSFCDVLNVLESIAQCKLSVKSQPRSKIKVDNVFINDRLVRAIGPYTFTPLAQGLRALYNHLNSYKETGEKNAGILQA
jgi:UDP-glucose 4-epimerase